MNIFTGLKKEQNASIRLILCIGLCLRIFYLLYTPCGIRSNDFWEIRSDSWGHAAYILNLLEGHLPRTNTVQFYQQPFYYLLSAGLAKISLLLMPGLSAYRLVSFGQIVSCTASCITLFLAKKLGETLRLSMAGLQILLLYVAFTPVFILNSGSVTPDALTTCFLTAEFLVTLLWKQRPCRKYLFALAFLYGFGIMTKISCATIVPFTALIFLQKLFQEKDCRRRLCLLKDYLLFGCISLPLGLWYALRNWLLFRQPLTYVPDLGKTSYLYRGDHSLVSRLFYVDIRNLFSGPYAVVADDYNAPVYFLKSSLFGEFHFSVPGLIPAMLLWSALLLALLFVAALLWNLRNPSGRFRKELLLMTFLFYGSILFFNIKYPYGCSMDYRYMGFFSVLGGCLFGAYADEYRKKGGAYGFAIVRLPFLLYAVCSFLMYTFAAWC